MKLILELDRLDETQREAHAIIGRELERGAYSTLGDSQAVTPVDTGRLRAGQHVMRIGNMLWIVYTVIEYAGYVHDGTVHFAGVPFFRIAYEKNRLQIIDNLRKSLGAL